MRRWIVCLLLGALAAGCSRAPDEAALRASLETELATRLPGLLALADVRRMGSAPDAAGGRIVYFRASLKLVRDHDFAAWAGPGSAQLAAVLGAGPKGLEGIVKGGNKAGSTLGVNGTARFREAGDGWTFVAAPAATAAPPAEAAQDVPETRLDRLLGAINAAARVSETAMKPPGVLIVEQELDDAWTRIQGRLTRARAGYALAAGPEDGEYWRVAKAIEAVATESELRTTALATAGSLDNLRLLAAGKVALVLVQSDVAAAAFRGALPASADVPTLSGLRALGALYPEPLQVLARADAPLANLADVRGRRVNLGPEGSGTRLAALAALAAHGLAPADFAEATALAPGEALAALAAGRLDAALQVIGAPAAQIQAAAARSPLKLVGLADDAVARLVKAEPAYVPYAIPAGTYPGQAAPVRTVAVTALLAGTDALTAREAARIAALVYDRVDYVAAGSLQGGLIGRAHARDGVTVPLHDGVLKPPETH